MAFPSTGLVSYWKFNESSGNAADAKSTNTLTNNGTATFTTGKIDNACALNGSSQYFNIADASQTGLDMSSGDISISFWCYPTGTPDGDGDTFCSKREADAGSGTNGYAFHTEEFGGSDHRFYIRYCTGSVNTALYGTSNDWGAVSRNNWHHIVFTVDVSAQTAKVYVDNSAHDMNYDSGSATSIGDSNGPFAIGVYQYRTDTFFYWFPGRLDEFGMWSRILDATEVSDLWNSGNGLTYTAAAGPANLKTYNTNTLANIKTINTNAIANVKTLDTNA